MPRVVSWTGECSRPAKGDDERRDADDSEEPALDRTDDQAEQQHDDQRHRRRHTLPDDEDTEQGGCQTAQLRQRQIDLAEEQDEVDAESQDREERDLSGEVD